MEPFEVLLVDDELDYLRTLAKRLGKRSITAHIVGSGEEALSRLDEVATIEVVVLDVRMPGMGGLATLKEIKRRHPLLEVVMLTGHADVDVAMEGMGQGAFDYLMKPVGIDELLYKLQDAREKKAIQEAKLRIAGEPHEEKLE